MKLKKFKTTVYFLFFCLLIHSISPAFPAAAAATEYTMTDLMTSSLPKGATIIIEDRKDLETLDIYIKDGMLSSSCEYTFRLKNDIAVSDYTFQYHKSAKTISIYYKNALAAVYDENTSSFYTDESLQTSTDFSFKGKPWEPVGSSSQPFCATFDGNNHKISGLWNTSSYSASSQTESGLFANLTDASVSNLTIDGAFLQLSYEEKTDYTGNNSCAVGLLSGYCDNTTIHNCTLQNALMDINNHSNAYLAVGGLCGKGYNNKFENTSASASIHLSADRKGRIPAKTSSNDSSIAGACGMLMGYIGSNHPITVSGCNTSGCITDIDSSYIIGGLCGKITGSLILVNCQNDADILSACIAGGLTGYIEMDAKEYLLDSSDELPPSYAVDSYCVYINRAVNTASINGIYAGGIVGISYDFCYFYDSSFSKSNYYRPLTVIIGSENSGAVRSSSRGGGMIALAGSPYLKDCSNRETIENTTTAAISVKDRSSVSLTEHEPEPSNAKLVDSDMKNTQEASACIGGLIGQTYHDTYIYNCYNDADIKTDFAVCGGLIGRTTEQSPCRSLIMENCFHSGTIHIASNSTAPAISTSSMDMSDQDDTMQDTLIRRPVLAASLIGYCYSNYNKQKINYCYTTEGDLPFCGYWPYSILDGSPLANNISALEPVNSCILSSSQLSGKETSKNIGSSVYNSYPDLLSCLNAWITNSENADRAYTSANYFQKSPQTWSDDTLHPSLILSPAPVPRKFSSIFAPAPSTPAPAPSTPAPMPSLPVPTKTAPPATAPPVPTETAPPVTAPPITVPPVSAPPEITPTGTSSPDNISKRQPTVTSSPDNTSTRQPAVTSSAPPKKSTSSAGPTLSKPNLLMVKANKTGGIRIIWHSTSSYDGYFVYRAMGQHKKYSLAATLNSSKKGKYFTAVSKSTGTRYTFIDTNTKANRIYYYKLIPYTLRNGKKISGPVSNRRKVLSRIMSPVLIVQRKKTTDGQRFLRIKLLKYQGRYADIYIRKNNKKYTLLQLKNDNIKKQKKTFDLHYTFRKATISIKVRTFQNKKRKNGSFYSKETVIQINE